jgi:hypothetical protein
MGRWNPRPINNAEVKKLVKSFQKSGISTGSNPIPLLLDPSSINVSELSSENKGDDTPYMVFQESARAGEMYAASGQHRMVALQRYLKEAQEEVEGLRKAEEKEEDLSKKSELQALLAEIKPKLNAGVLVVEVYDMGECSRVRGRHTC